MKIVIRADASKLIGSGHVMRCLTLAEGLRERGAQVSFISQHCDGDLCDLISQKGFKIRESWVERFKPDWLIVDHYELGEDWEYSMRSHVKRIMVIDDLARPHDCDVLLDQNLVANFGTRYVGKVPGSCALLLGPQYALLQPIYRELHDRTPPREGPIKRIMISFGGGDVAGMTDFALDTVQSLKCIDVKVDVVQPGDNLPSLAPLIARADLAIGAAGTTAWERLCLGLPSLVITVADNQVPIAKELCQRELIRWVRHPEDLKTELAKVLDVGLDASWSKHCSSIVDGCGLERILAVLMAHRDMLLRVRAAILQDEELLLEWVNDPLVRINSFDSDKIMPVHHWEWFYRRLRDLDNCRIYVVETETGVPVGQVRFERREEKWELNYSLGSVFRGKGLGKLVVEQALAKLHSELGRVQVFAQTKDTNEASKKICASLGLLCE